MSYLIYPPTEKFRPKSQITLEIGEIEDFDFTECSKQIFNILQVLEACNLIEKNPHENPIDVLDTIDEMITNDLNFGSDELQITEYKHIRIEFRDELFSLEVFVGV